MVILSYSFLAHQQDSPVFQWRYASDRPDAYFQPHFPIKAQLILLGRLGAYKVLPLSSGITTQLPLYLLCSSKSQSQLCCWPWLALVVNYHKGFILTTFCLPICSQSSHACQETQILPVTEAELWPGKGCFNFNLFLVFLHSFSQSGWLVCSPTPLCSKLMFSAC